MVSMERAAQFGRKSFINYQRPSKDLSKVGGRRRSRNGASPFDRFRNSTESS